MGRGIRSEESGSPRFVAYFLQNVLRNYQSEKAAVPGVNRNVLHELKVRSTDTKSQEKVANVLSAYDDLIENNRRRMALLEEAARELYREWFVRLRFPGHEHTRITNGVPEGWERIYLGDSVETQYGFTETATDEPVGPKFLRGTDINKTPFIDWSTVPYCPIDEILQRKYQLRVGDIVIIRMADPGKVAIVERDIDAVFASYLIRLLPTNPRLTPYYLFYVLSDDGYQGFIAGVSTGSTRKTASAPLLVDFHLILPPQTLLRTFEDSVRLLRQQITTLLIQNEKLRVARDLLLPAPDERGDRGLRRCTAFLPNCLTGNLAEIEYRRETSAGEPRAATIRLRPDAQAAGIADARSDRTPRHLRQARARAAESAGQGRHDRPGPTGALPGPAPAAAGGQMEP